MSRSGQVSRRSWPADCCSSYRGPEVQNETTHRARGRSRGIRTHHTGRHQMIRYLALAVALLVPAAAYSQADPVNLTAVFVDGGVTIDRLLVYQFGGIVLIRGRTGDPL